MFFVHALLVSAVLVSTGEAPPVTTASLLAEMVDQERLAHLPELPYRTIQFSSFDRRSTHRDAASWFANSDGFGRESVPGFAAVLREPDATGVGLFLVAEVDGPGAIVRGWSAGMGGTLRVHLDGREEPVFAGPAYDFLARRSRHFEALSLANWWAEPDLFVQQDADYLPIPFARGLRVTWEGTIGELHFYHLQVRRYVAGTRVETFDPESLSAAVDAMLRRHAAARAAEEAAEKPSWAFEMIPGGTAEQILETAEPAAVRYFSLQFQGADVEAVLRGVLLRIHFDGADEPQVEAPAGDFFGSGIGINPFDAVPMTVRRDARMICRFVMPYRERAVIRLVNHSGRRVFGQAEIVTAPFPFDERTPYFRARWRVDHELRVEGGAGPYDLPYLVAIGRGRLVGAACMLMNPLPAPQYSGNWWGEGDEKIQIDGEARPSTFGTGSEDFYNYAWSRIDLFAAPYCGQPLDSGPGNCGYVSNHRFFVLDDLPFERCVAFYVEMWSHRPVAPVSYGRIVWWYALPGAVDDHRRLQAAELFVPPVPRWEGDVWSQADEATCRPATNLDPRPSAGVLDRRSSKLTRGGPLLSWKTDRAADRLDLTVFVPEAGRYEVYLVALLPHDGPILALKIDDQPLLRKRDPALVLRSAFQPRLLGFAFDPVALEAGSHVLGLETVVPGEALLDSVVLRKKGGPPLMIAGAVEGERLELVQASDGLEVQTQGMAADQWSGGAHLWVKATRRGDFLELKVPVPAPGRYHVRLRLTKSWDYTRLGVFLDGERFAEEIDTFNPGRAALLPDVDLGVRDLGDTAILRLETVGHHKDSAPPYYYFGLDCVVLEKAEE